MWFFNNTDLIFKRFIFISNEKVGSLSISSVSFFEDFSKYVIFMKNE